MRNAHGRNTDSSSELGLGYILFFEDFPKELTRMNRRQTILDHVASQSVVVGDLNTVRFAHLEPKADSPVIIDANTVLALTISLERLQSVRGRQSKIFQTRSGVELRKTHRRAATDFRRETPRTPCREESLRLCIGERLNHPIRA